MTKKFRNDGFIDDLLVKYLLKEVSRDEAGEVEQWINASSGNQRHYNELKQVWEASEQLFGETPSEDDAWERFQQRMQIADPKTRSIGSFKSNKTKSWLAGAAAVLILGAAAFWLTRSAFNFSGMTLSADSKALTDTLPDQTIITLNKNSYITYPKSLKGNKRSVELQGEAFFTVSHKDDAPFIVHVDEVTITDIGTEFNVKETEQYTEVIVATGSVVVSVKGKSVLLKANEKVVVSKKEGLLKKEQIQNKLYNYYQTKQFVCENTPLSELTQTLSEAYDTDIVIHAPELARLPITTTFQSDQPLDSILNIISQTFEEISVSKQGEKIILSRK